MLLPRRTRALALAATAFALWPHGDAAARGSPIPELQASVVKIYSTLQYPDYSVPWQVSSPMGGTGSGFIVGKRRILTNAHVVSNARFIEVQREGDPRKYPAEVLFAAHDCDLALLGVADERFFDGTQPLEIGERLPDRMDEVTVIGYPLGGTRVSVTRGVVSRIDYSVYTHSGVDAHLVLQVDAAINPGNSGGPVIFSGRAVGVAFQVLVQGQNIGYAIPSPVIRRFMADIADGRYDGYPELGVVHVGLENTALRRDLKLPADRTGVAVSMVDPYGSAYGKLRGGDVLLEIDGHRIFNDGTIKLDGNTVEYAELLERKQAGDSVTLLVWRDGANGSVSVPLRRPDGAFTFRNSYDRRPRFLMVAGLVFSPLTSEYLRTIGQNLSERENQHLLYYSQFAKLDGHYENRDEFVVLISRLAHRVNTDCEAFERGIVAEANGRRIRNLKELKLALASPVNGFHVIRFEGRAEFLVMRAEAAAAATREIMADYGVPAVEWLEDGE